MTISFFLCIVSGLFSIVVGWFIWKKDWHHFVASIHPEAYKAQPQKFAQLVGQYAIFTGLLTVVLPFALEQFDSFAFAFYVIFAVGSLFYIFFKIKSLIR